MDLSLMCNLVLLVTLSRCVLLSVMLCASCFLCVDFLQCDVQLLVLAACGQSWQRLGYQLHHQVSFNPWDQTQPRFEPAALELHMCCMGYNS